MSQRKVSGTGIIKGMLITLLLLAIIGAGLYSGFTAGFTPLQNLFTGQMGESKTPAVSPEASAAPSTEVTRSTPAQFTEPDLGKLAEEALQSITKGQVSKPSVSPDKKRIAYVSPFDWEVIGEVHIYDVISKKDTVAVNSSNVKFQYTPKDVGWLDDRYLLVVIGYGYGTVTVGGDLYVLDTRDNKLSLAAAAGERREFKDIYMEKGILMLDTAVFNADLTNYTLEKKKLTSEEILAAIKK